MAAKAKKSRRTSGGKTASARPSSKTRGGVKKSAAKRPKIVKRGAVKKAAKKVAKKATTSAKSIIRRVVTSPTKKATAKKVAGKKPAAKKSTTKKATSPLARVTRVAKEVAQQATTAVNEGVEQLKEMSENLVDRVTG